MASQAEQAMEERLQIALQQIERLKEHRAELKQVIHDLSQKAIVSKTPDSVVLYYKDQETIVGMAKDLARNEAMPVILKKDQNITELTSDQAMSHFIIRATIGFLNKNKFLNKLPKFNIHNKH